MYERKTTTTLISTARLPLTLSVKVELKDFKFPLSLFDIMLISSSLSRALSQWNKPFAEYLMRYNVIVVTVIFCSHLLCSFLSPFQNSTWYPKNTHKGLTKRMCQLHVTLWLSISVCKRSLSSLLAHFHLAFTFDNTCKYRVTTEFSLNNQNWVSASYATAD